MMLKRSRPFSVSEYWWYEDPSARGDDLQDAARDQVAQAGGEDVSCQAAGCAGRSLNLLMPSNTSRTMSNDQRSPITSTVRATGHSARS